MKTNVRKLVNKFLQDNPGESFSVEKISIAVDRSISQVMKVLRYDVDTIAPQFNMDPAKHKVEDRRYGYVEPELVSKVREQEALLLEIETQQLKDIEADTKRREIQERMRRYLLKTGQKRLT